LLDRYGSTSEYLSLPNYIYVWSLLGRETLLFTSGASEELRCWKLDSHAPQGTTFDFDPGRDLLDMSCLEWAASPMVRYVA
jgi:hypothetical protein